MGLSCGEGPIWEANRQRLLFVDSDRTFLYAYDPATETVETLSDDIQISGIALAGSGYVLLGDGAWLMHEDGSKELLFSEYEGEKLFFNDNCVGPDGRIYAGTYYWTENGMSKTGKLFRIEKGKDPVVLDEGIELSNGIGFSPDEKTMYYSDSAKKKVFQYDFDKATGNICNKRVFIETEIGIPDGLTVDAQGCVWVAHWYEGCIGVYAPDGKLERKLEFPVKQVASCNFGGPDYTTLYITSAAGAFISEMMPKGFENETELGGQIFTTDTGVKGKPEYISAF